MNSDDIITKEDERKFVSVAELKRWRNKTIQDLNEIIKSFQGSLVTSQVRTNLVWNGVNAVLRSFLDRGLVTHEDVEKAGQILMEEAKKNLEKVKEISSQGRRVEESELIPTPLDDIKNLIYPKTNVTNKDSE